MPTETEIFGIIITYINNIWYILVGNFDFKHFTQPNIVKVLSTQLLTRLNWENVQVYSILIMTQRLQRYISETSFSIWSNSFQINDLFFLVIYFYLSFNSFLVHKINSWKVELNLFSGKKKSANIFHCIIRQTIMPNRRKKLSSEIFRNMISLAYLFKSISTNMSWVAF